MSRAERSTKLDLDRIVFIGRTHEEYMKMFSLTEEELVGKKILDCPSGACSFTAIANQLGLDVTACDIAYYHAATDLRVKGLQDIEHAMEYVNSSKANYKWDYFKDIESLRKARLSALNDSSEHRIEFPSRYIPVTLPILPFEDGQFDVIVSAHLLFTYADRLDYDFHIATLNELLRVTNDEIRIFPLVDSEGQRYEHLDKIIDYLQVSGCSVNEVKVQYEFQSNANSMLKVTKIINK